jgi:hypothetical protein
MPAIKRPSEKPPMMKDSDQPVSARISGAVSTSE